MIKSPLPTLHKMTRPEITPLFGSAKLVLGETPKAIPPFGGLASFISFLGQIGFAGQVRQHLPFAKDLALFCGEFLQAFLQSHPPPIRGFQRRPHVRCPPGLATA